MSGGVFVPTPVSSATRDETNRRLVLLVVALGVTLSVYAALVDTVTTILVLRHGGRELNPLMVGVADSRWLLLAVKLGSSGIVTAIVAVLWRRSWWAAAVWVWICALGQSWPGWYNLAVLGLR
ncbi:MAG TPA: DUF5658 family protein [Acidimicrobiales bacterium]|jgi:hypothetical protein|nr:DUF5658 family protein [Acidimicrobiales bacterium]